LLDEILKDHPLDPWGTMHYGGRGPKTLLICGAFEADSTVGLLDWLPATIVLDAATSGLGRWVNPMIDLVRAEGQGNPGDAAVMAKVADVFLTDVLRHYLVSSSDAIPHSPSSLSNDPPISQAMTLIHDGSDRQWTVDGLAHQVGMSRSSFSARFRGVVGMGPIAYLTRVRMARAAGGLATSSRAIAEIAHSAGYDNESSFSKAFVRQFGQPPGQYRREHRWGDQVRESS
jgi:transcriptional regulator GlxA family with amidase domain